MALDVRTVELTEGSDYQNQDRVVVGKQSSIANAAGSGAGSAVTVAVSFTSSANLPSKYSVAVNPGQACFWHVPQNSKTSTGFNVVLTPKDGSTTIAAGSIDIIVEA